MTVGVPFIEGVVKDPGKLSILLPDGQKAHAQAQVTATWPDGSIRWAVLNWRMSFAKNESSSVCVIAEAAAPAPGALELEQDAEGITARNAFYSARISSGSGIGLKSFKVGNREMLAPDAELVLETPDGKLFYASLAKARSLRVLASGPELALVEISGRMTAEDDSECLDFRFRFTFRAGDPVLRLDHKMTNRAAPELGIHIRRLYLTLPTVLGDRAIKQVRQATHGLNWWPRAVSIRENVELQAGSFKPSARVEAYGSLQDGKVVIRNFGSFKEDISSYPHYLRPGNARSDIGGGLHAAYRHLIATSADAGTVAWMPQMERHFPKGIAFTRGEWRFDFWPEWADPLRLNRGMSREHTLFLTFQGQGASPDALESIVFDHEIQGTGVTTCGDTPIHTNIEPEYARQCRVLDLHRWLPFDEKRYLQAEIKLGTYSASFAAARGELELGDSEIRGCSANNENDRLLERFRSIFRLGTPGALSEAIVAARHNAHVDLIAYDPDPLREGTMAAHCPNHSDGATYPSHMWVGGLLAAYHTTADTDFLEAALSVGENMRRWQTQRPEIFYCDSRECGWPMLAFVQLWHHTHEQRWLDYADEVFQAYKKMMQPSGEILHEIPHGLGTLLIGYGEFMTWRACFFYYEASGKQEVKDFLVKCLSLPGIYIRTPAQCARGGWACNDLFPAWAAFALTNDSRFLTDNRDFLKYLMSLNRFPWGGVDVHYFLNALHERGELDAYSG